MKLLLYCTKEKPYLYKTNDTMIEKMNGDYHTQLNKAVLNNNCLNGKIVAECDFDVEEIEYSKDYNEWKWYTTKSLYESQLCTYSCLSVDELENYLGDKGGYAIHIKNLNVFDEPTPDLKYCVNKSVDIHILFPVSPLELKNIPNGDKFIVIRKKVLKEMITSGNNQ